MKQPILQFSVMQMLQVASCLFMALLLTACQPGIAQVDAVSCLGNFEATVQQGPSAGLAVKGALLFTLDQRGELIGSVATVDGAEIPAVGQVNGRAINLTFTVGEQKFIFGVGSATRPVYTCGGVWGGGFTGPELGDSGDWLAADSGNIIDPNFEYVIDPNFVEDTTNLTLPGGDQGGTVNFECKETSCTCKGGQDCIDLADAKICKTPIRFKDNQDNTGTCTYR